MQYRLRGGGEKKMRTGIYGQLRTSSMTTPSEAFLPQ